MTYYGSPSLLDRLVAACFKLLFAGVAVLIAVRILESVWLVLVGVGIGVMALAGLVTVLRRRRQGW